MRSEINKHWGKLKKISKLSEKDLLDSHYMVTSKINFINEELIPKKIWLDSEKIVKEIDINDIDFIALTKHIKGYLWTGDFVLYKGLKTKKFKRVYNTNDLFLIREKIVQ